ncbi:MAG: AMP-binding protein [Micropruina sp.]|uniref:(2,3-dihydroxybenzoyl)adenylate synthase n=1 Tax=Micropruina sp. TaxID=2737536 RepID=UPI0039E6C132
MSRSPLADVRSWPPDVRARYRAAGYWTDETFAAFIEDRTTRFAGNLAVVGQNAAGVPQQWSYAELGDRARTAAARLAASGVEPGDRVVVALPNITEYLEVVLGLFRLGALPVFALPTHRELELTQFCVLADAAALVMAVGADRVDHRALYDTVAAQAADRGVVPPVLIDVGTWASDAADGDPGVRRDDEMGRDDGAGRDDAGVRRRDDEKGPDAEQVAFLQLSGGTTGVAKLIPRTAADYLYSVRASAEICGLDASTRALIVLPAAHNFPMSSPGILGVLHTGGAVVLARDPSPRTAFRLIAEHGVTDAALVPPLAQAWISAATRRRPDLSTLRVVQVGGARLSDTVAPAIREVLGARLQQVFGMAEGLVNYTRADDPDELVHTTQGTPISPDDELRIVDADDHDVPEGTEGRLLVRGPYTIRGYYRSPQADIDSFTADGYYRTGDLVRRLPSGHLIVTGRDSDLINRGGEKVSTEELEGFALTHPAVLDAVAIGVPDAYLGERVVLVARTEPGTPQPDLIGHLRGVGLATYKVPDEVVFLDELPATHVGKNSRRELRRLLASTLDPRSAQPKEHR